MIKLLGAFIVIMLAVAGICIASSDITVRITSPQNGAHFLQGDIIPIRSSVSGSGEGYLACRTFVNGVKITSSKWIPSAPGEYTIVVKASNNPGFVDASQDSVTITVNR